MAKVTIVKCDITGETFEEGTPGSVSFTFRPIKPDNYEELSDADKLPFVAHQLDLSAAGVAKLRLLGGTAGTINTRGGRPSPNQGASDATNGAQAAPPADGPAAVAEGESPAPAPTPSRGRARGARAGAAS